MRNYGRVCPGCGEITDGSCCGTSRRRDGRIVTPRRRLLEKVWHSARWRALAARVLERDRRCVDCGAVDDLVADHDDGFEGPDDPRAWDEQRIHARCRSCSGSKDGQARRGLRQTVRREQGQA